MLLNKNHFNLLSISEKSSTSYSLSGLHIKSGKVTVSNVHSAYYLPACPSFKEDDFPEHDSSYSTQLDPEKEYFIPKKVGLKAQKNIPRKSGMPILEHCQVMTDTDHERLYLASSDLESIDSISCKNKPNFPDLTRLDRNFKSSAKETDQGFRVTVQELENLVKIAKKIVKKEGDDNVQILDFKINSDMNCLKVTGKTENIEELTGYIMLCNPD